VPGQRDAGARDARARDGGQPVSADHRGRLADAWPYAAADGRRAEGRHADAWPYASADEPRSGTRGDSSAADSWPQAGRRSRSGQPAVPPGRTSSYADESGPGEPDDIGSTGPSGRSYHYGESEFGSDQHAAAGRSPANRSPVGDWPYPHLDANVDWDRATGSGRSPSGRSAAGAWPYQDSDAGEFGSDRRSRPQRPNTRSYKLDPGASSARGSRRYDEPDQPGREPASDPGDGYDRAPAGRRGRHGSGRWARTGSSRRGQDRHDRGRSETDWPGADQRGPDGEDLRRAGAQHTDPGRSARTAREPAGSSPPEGWRRRGREDREASPSGSRREQRQPAGQPPAWSDDDVLEPLPPLDSPGRPRGRQSAWRSAQGAGDRDRLGDDEDADRRWSHQPEFEPGYEGDTW
jgi:hypothetical protein